MFVVSSAETKTSGRCSASSAYDETECRTSPYPGSRFWSAVTSDKKPGGCYIMLSSMRVYWNADAGIDCTSDRKCLCKKNGKFTPYSIYCTPLSGVPYFHNVEFCVAAIYSVEFPVLVVRIFCVGIGRLQYLYSFPTPTSCESILTLSLRASRLSCAHRFYASLRLRFAKL